MIDIVYLTIGLVLLVYGGELLLSNTVRFAQLIRISTIWISVVIISFGTSAPELIVSMDAAYRSLPDIAIGNVIGSNIANTLLVLGAAAIIQPIPVEYRELRVENFILLFVFLALCFCMYQGFLHYVFGCVCLGALTGYIGYSYHHNSTLGKKGSAEKNKNRNVFKSLLLAVVGLILLIIGAEFLVDGAVGIARFLKVSEAVISLSMVAVGTSLPELVTAVLAAYRGHNYVSLANVVGSNLFNIMVVLGLTSLFFTLTINSQFLEFDMWVMGGVTALLFIIICFFRQVSRGFGAVLLLSYACYITYLYIKNGAS